jgi:hypothetical protein
MVSPLLWFKVISCYPDETTLNLYLYFKKKKLSACAYCKIVTTVVVITTTQIAAYCRITFLTTT